MLYSIYHISSKKFKRLKRFWTLCFAYNTRLRYLLQDKTGHIATFFVLMAEMKITLGKNNGQCIP